MESKFEKTKGKSHLDKDFLEELKHKLWSTRGSRLRASERLKTQNLFSYLSTSLLSAYLIIFGLLSVYNLHISNPQLSDNLIPFSITSVSIFLLVFSLFENAKRYEIRAIEFHNCSLEIARLYNELQTFKSYNKDATIQEIENVAMILQDKYQTILEKYENHKQIDNKIFKLEHRDYYDDIKWYHVIEIKLINFSVTYLPYLVAMIIPGIVLIYIITLSISK